MRVGLWFWERCAGIIGNQAAEGVVGDDRRGFGEG